MTAKRNALGLLTPFTSEPSIHRCVGNLAIHDAALMEEPFIREPEPVKDACRSYIPGIGIRFDAIQVQFGGSVVKERGPGFVHVVLRPRSTIRVPHYVGIGVDLKERAASASRKGRSSSLAVRIGKFAKACCAMNNHARNSPSRGPYFFSRSSAASLRNSGRRRFAAFARSQGNDTSMRSASSSTSMVAAAV